MLKKTNEAKDQDRKHLLTVKKYKSKSTLNSWSSIFLMAFKAKRRFLKKYMRVQKKKLKEFKKRIA